VHSASDRGPVAQTTNGPASRAGVTLVRGQCHLSGLEGYAAELNSGTAGRGRYALYFSTYEPVPAQVQQKLVDAFKPHHDDD